MSNISGEAVYRELRSTHQLIRYGAFLFGMTQAQFRDTAVASFYAAHREEMAGLVDAITLHPELYEQRVAEANARYAGVQPETA